ncbi:MAG TPA: SAF domain-containing protein [Clostridiales bacterium]|nr:SAF domain-containing protein [Clostridiales bacterium]
MKRVNILILTIILVVILLIIEVIIVRSAAEYEPKVNAVFAAVDILAGEIIKDEMLEKREISISLVHQKSFKTKDEIIGKKAKNDMEKGEMILAGRIYTDGEIDEIQVLDSKNRLFTVEFKGDQVNGWWLKEGQYVDIIFIPSERIQKESVHGIENNNIQRVINVRVAAIIDDKGKLVKGMENASTPKYISFEVDDRLDEFLAYAKGNGRIEVSVIPDMEGLQNK